MLRSDFDAREAKYTENLIDILQKDDFIDYNCLKNDAKIKIYSHDNLFHSMLGLLEIKTKEYNRDLDVFTNCRTKSLPAEDM